jgi:hypothetical protein
MSNATFTCRKILNRAAVVAVAGTAVVGILLTGPSAHAANGEWSKYKSCDAQYDRDIAVCQRARTRACWASAAERLGKCDNSKGKTLNAPQLMA